MGSVMYHAEPPLTFKTASDFSGNAGKGVTVGATENCVLVASQGGYCDGVILDGESASVAIETRPGLIVMALAGTGGVTAGAEATPETGGTGLFEVASSGDWVRGKALRAASANQEFPMLLLAPYIKA